MSLLPLINVPNFSGFDDVAALYLSKFKWGKSFLQVNQEILAQYSKCKTSAEVVAAQAKFLNDEFNLRQQRRGSAMLCFIS